MTFYDMMKFNNFYKTLYDVLTSYNECIFIWGDLGLFEGDILLTDRQLSALKAASLEPRGDLGKVTYNVS